MGGCATKPKADAGEAPPPEQEPEPELEKSAPRAAADVKEAVVILDKAKEIVVEDDAVEEHGNRRRSLSNLFKENNEAMESTKLDKPTLDPGKQEEPSDQKFAEVSETKLNVDRESDKIETPVERTLKEVEATVETNKEKAIEAAPSAGALADHEAIKSPAPALVEMQKHEEKKTLVKEKLAAVETQKPETPKEEKLDVVTHPKEQKAAVEATILIENPQIPEEKTTNE